MYVNEAFCRMTGYERDEIIGRNCRFLQGPDSDPGAIARIREAMQQVRRRRHAFHRLDGLFTFRICRLALILSVW